MYRFNVQVTAYRRQTILDRGVVTHQKNGAPIVSLEWTILLFALMQCNARVCQRLLSYLLTYSEILVKNRLETVVSFGMLLGTCMHSVEWHCYQ